MSYGGFNGFTGFVAHYCSAFFTAHIFPYTIIEKYLLPY